jgi:anti-sigma B factor antagonist
VLTEATRLTWGDTVAHDAGDRLAAAGDLDVATGPLLLRQVRRLVERGATTVTLDLDTLDFVDAAGVGSLLAAKRLVEAKGGVLVLTPPPAPVDRVLRLCGVCDALGLTVSRSGDR